MMNRKIVFWAAVLLVAIFFAGCESSVDKETTAEAVQLIVDAQNEKDYQRMLSLADSLEGTALSEGESFFWKGMASYRMMQRRTASFYWKEGLRATEKSTSEADLATYAKTASYLVGLYCRNVDFSGALKISVPVLERLDKLKCDTTSHYTNLLVFTGCCQAHFGTPDSVVNVLFDRAYDRHMANIEKNHSHEAYRDAVVAFINIAYGWISEKKYSESLVWTERLGQLVEVYESHFADDSVYIDKQFARYKIFSAIGQAGLGEHEKAAKAFAEYQKTSFAQSSEGQLDAADYLSIAGLWKEAAASYRNVEEHNSREQVPFSLDIIQRYILKKYHANRMAGFVDSANVVANIICERLDSSILVSKSIDAEEQEIIRQNEMQIASQQERLFRTRITVLITSIIVLIVFFTIFTIFRHRSARRLAKLNAAKERMEGELSIARDIQMSMVPSTFPEIEGLDMYATMTPAKEVGGDLYSSLIKDDYLYFCIGDVSGKGVPASLFMAQAMRLFHAMATYGLHPTDIATYMNNELSGADNEQGMFVTMFICRLNMKLCLLEYCNAGHNPPVMGNADGQFSFLEMEPNAPIGLWPGLEYVGETIDYFRDRLLLLYTDGLNEAENPQQEQFGDDRIIEIMTSLTSKKARDIVDALGDEVSRFRDGAEPNDDLTMLCLNFKLAQS